MASSTISGVTTKLAVLRDGEYLNFSVGDVLKDGDVLVTKLLESKVTIEHTDIRVA